jgi:hypothetical protein
LAAEPRSRGRLAGSFLGPGFLYVISRIARPGIQGNGRLASLQGSCAMATGSDCGKTAGNDARIRANLGNFEPLPEEGHSLMCSFLAIASPSVRRLIVELVVEMSKLDGSVQSTSSATRC